MSGGDSDFVNPQFRSLIRVNIMNSRCKSHNEPRIHGDCQMMTRIAKKLFAEVAIYGVIENSRGHFGENIVVASA